MFQISRFIREYFSLHIPMAAMLGSARRGVSRGIIALNSANLTQTCTKVRRGDGTAIQLGRLDVFGD